MKQYVSAVALDRSRFFRIILTVLGALAGYLYSMFICATPVCAITSNLIILTVYCGVLGFLFADAAAGARKENRHE